MKKTVADLGDLEFKGLLVALEAMENPPSLEELEFSCETGELAIELPGGGELIYDTDEEAFWRVG